MDIYKIRILYRLALSEGEGLGTAYEYYVKAGLLERILKNKKIKDVLVYGLPERYGYSIDFIYFCIRNKLEITIFEKEKEKITRLKKVLKRLKDNGIDLGGVKIINRFHRKYNLILSCEVVQAMNKHEAKSYAEEVQKYSKMALIFVPNKSNKCHMKFSGLNGFYLEELKVLFKHAKEAGYIDMPPFPPGIKKKRKLRSSVFVEMMQIFAFLERIAPMKLRKRYSHICYVLV